MTAVPSGPDITSAPDAAVRPVAPDSPEVPDSFRTPVLTVVVPVYNEEEVLPLLAQRLRPVLDGLGEPYEVLCVDDGSTDLSPAILERERRGWPQLRVVRLRTNSGHQAALSAGLARARGAWVATLDADLQDPPEVLPTMLATARDARADVVYGVRDDRSTDSTFKRVTARTYYRLMRRLLGGHVPADAGDFRLMSRATVDAVNCLPEHNRVLRLVVPALGFPDARVGYKRQERAAGRTKYPLSRMIRLSVDSLTGFSVAPLRLATWFGLGGALITVLFLATAVVAYLSGHVIPGWTSIAVVVAGVGAVQLLCLGMLGEYVGRLYTQMQGRPAYYVAHDSLDEPRPPAAGLAIADDPPTPSRRGR